MSGAQLTDGARLEGRERELYVSAMFDRIAGPYDRLNHLISLGRDRRGRAIALGMAGVRAGDRVLDLGTGTGDFAAAASKAVGEGGEVLGIDLSDAMIEVARVKLD